MEQWGENSKQVDKNLHFRYLKLNTPLPPNLLESMSMNMSDTRIYLILIDNSAYECLKILRRRIYWDNLETLFYIIYNSHKVYAVLAIYVATQFFPLQFWYSSNRLEFVALGNSSEDLATYQRKPNENPSSSF